MSLRDALQLRHMFRNLRFLVICVLCLAFVIRIAAAVDWHSKAPEDGAAFRLGDSDSYWVLGKHIARGEPYQYGSAEASVFRAPILPILLAPLTILEDQSAAILIGRIINCGLGTLAVGLLMVLTNRIAGTCAAIAAGTLAAMHPGSIGMSITILAEGPFLTLMIGHLLFLHVGIQRLRLDRVDETDATHPSPYTALALSGVLAGLAILTRPSWLLFLPFATVLAVLLSRHRRKLLVASCICLTAVCLTMLPWWYRNAQVTNRFVPTTLQVGLSLYDGLHDGATGASDEGMQFSFELQEEQRTIDRATALPGTSSTFEYRVDKLARNRALAWAAQNPSEVLTLAIAKFRRTWSLWPDGGDAGSPAIRLAVTLGTFGVLLLAIWGTWQSRLLAIKASGTTLALCWLPCIYFTLLHMVFVGSVRYREPGVFVLCSLAGIGLASIAGCYSGKRANSEQSLTELATSTVDVVSAKERNKT